MVEKHPEERILKIEEEIALHVINHYTMPDGETIKQIKFDVKYYAMPGNYGIYVTFNGDEEHVLAYGTGDLESWHSIAGSPYYTYRDGDDVTGITSLDGVDVIYADISTG